MKKTKLLIVATHPIQYQAPWFRELSKVDNIDVLVWFGIIPDEQQQGIGFGKSFSWDIPLTKGYQWHLLKNKSQKPNLTTFAGIDCPEVYKELENLKPDAIVITGWHSKLLLQISVAAYRLNIKTIMRGDSNAKKKRPIYIRIIHRLMLSRFDAFLAVGKSNTTFYEMNGVNKNKIFNAPHFIENQRFLNASDVSNNDIKTTSNKNFNFIFAGKLSEIKNIHHLLNAFEITYNKHSNATLVIIGDGELRSELENHANKKDLPVSFLGFLNQTSLPLAYAKGDCLLLSSIETWGLVVNEAMVCGLPAILSDKVGASDDLIIEGETGFIYPHGDIQTLSEKMNYMVKHPNESKAMGQNAKNHILKNYTIEHTTNAIQEILTMFEK